MKTASKFVELAYAWKGRNENDGSHKEIIDVYNSHKPHPRGYKLSYKDAWCAGFVSAVSIKGGFTDIIPIECSCEKMIALFKKLGVWIENENRVPKIGDIVFYDWQDNGNGDNVGWCDHVGIVTFVSRETFTVIEGNYSNAVKERVIKFNDKCLRGFAVPKYDEEVSKPSEEVSNPSELLLPKATIEMYVISKGVKDEQVKTLQRLLIAKGFSCGDYGVDGSFGGDTLKAVKAYQEKYKLEVDGIVGKETWTHLLKG